MRLLVSLLFLFLLLPGGAVAQQKSHWLGTWAASPMRLEEDRAANLPIGSREVTLRQVVHISQGGKQMRVVLSNEFGDAPLTVASAHVAFLASGSRILPLTDHALTFNGGAGVTIAPGKTAASDPLNLVLPIFSDLVLSFHLPAQELHGITFHASALATSYFAEGDQTAAFEFVLPSAVSPGLTAPNVAAPIEGNPRIPTSSKPIVASGTLPASEGAASGPVGTVLQTTSWYFLKDVEVNATRKSAAVVAFGDSITDGARSTPELNGRYPDQLAPLLAANKKTAAVAVLNQGIGGNRILHDGYGPRALDRFDRDVLEQPGVRYVILLEGINDIGTTSQGREPVTARQVIDGLTDLALRAHARHVRVFGATLTPFAGAGYATAEGEAMRQEVNAFVRSSSVFDGMIDFDKAVRNPRDPARLWKRYDSGDHLHPNDNGYAAMAKAVDLKLFRRK